MATIRIIVNYMEALILTLAELMVSTKVAVAAVAYLFDRKLTPPINRTDPFRHPEIMAADLVTKHLIFWGVVLQKLSPGLLQGHFQNRSSIS